MKILIDGDPIVAQEVLAQIQLWDNAVIGSDALPLVAQCSKDMTMFDVSCELNGAEQYKTEWQKFSPYFNPDMKIARRNAKLYASGHLAVLYCHSRVEHSAMKGKLRMPWCRTTLCLQKQNNDWRVVHQHISMPIDLITGKAIILKDEPKLKLVV